MPNRVFNDLDLSRAAEILEEMTDKEQIGHDGCPAYKGRHPDLGQIYLVLPPIGNPLLLPFVIRADVL